MAGPEQKRSVFETKDLSVPEGSSVGLNFEPYTQLDKDLGFSAESVRRARAEQQLAGKNIVVVGASYHGIGGAVLRELAAQGARVAGVSRKHPSHPEVDKLMNEVNQIGTGDGIWMQGDITNKVLRETIIGVVVSEFGALDGIVIAVAADLNDKPFTDYTEEEFRTQFETNFFAPMFMMQEALIQMEKQRQGKGVFVSSISAIGSPKQAPYSSAKAGAEAIIRGLRMEKLDYLRGKISVNALASGFVADTPLTESLNENQQRRIVEFTTGERNLLAAEVAEPIAYLLNPNVSTSGKVYPLIGRGPMPALDSRLLIPR